MVNNEIIKGLECCCGTAHDSCYDCPYVDVVDCTDKLEKDALDLINQQRAEIKRLEEEIEEANKADREAELQALAENKEKAKMFSEAIKNARRIHRIGTLR